jgi:WD40 repeat protein
MTGHSGVVNGIDWSPNGEYLISAGYVDQVVIILFSDNPHGRLDQTTRIHGPVRNVDVDFPSWCELARPQVHGYNLHDVVFLDALKFVSIADEKVTRVFEAPRTFLTLVESLGIAKFTPEEVSFSSVLR